MTGIDKILAKLSADCEAECAAILQSAEESAQKILADAKKQGEEQASDILKAAEKNAEDTIRLANSSAEMKARQKELTKKVQILNGVLQDVLLQLQSMDDAEYFSVLEQLAADNAQCGQGILLLSQKDLEAAPKDFSESLNRKIADRGSLSLKASALPAKSGVILVYGDVEMNLTFEALLADKEDDLKETARKILFD